MACCLYSRREGRGARDEERLATGHGAAAAAAATVPIARLGGRAGDSEASNALNKASSRAGRRLESGKGELPSSSRASPSFARALFWKDRRRVALLDGGISAAQGLGEPSLGPGATPGRSAGTTACCCRILTPKQGGLLPPMARRRAWGRQRRRR